MLFKTQEWLQRPAKKQVNDTSLKDAAYVEGNYDYNIWYDKYLTDRQARNKRLPALYKCDPDRDAGYTKADTLEKQGASSFCVYFARGHCTEGAGCRYSHRMPTHDDCLRAEDNVKDVFGRTRHATHKDNMSGIGSFNVECRTIYFSGVPLSLMPSEGSTWQ